MTLYGPNDLSVQADLNDALYDHDMKIFGSFLGHYVPHTSYRLKNSNPVLLAKPAMHKTQDGLFISELALIGLP